MAVAVASRTHLAPQALLFFLAAYAVTNLGAFAVLAELPAARTLTDFSGLMRRHPALGASLLVALLGFVGTPPTAIFIGKLTLFSAAGDAGLGWLVVVAAVNTVASLFYYLRWIAPALLRAPTSPQALEPAGTWSRWTAYLAAIGSLAFGFGSGAGIALFTGPLTGT